MDGWRENKKNKRRASYIDSVAERHNLLAIRREGNVHHPVWRKSVAGGNLSTRGQSRYMPYLNE